MLALGTLYQRTRGERPAAFVAHYNLRGCIHTLLGNSGGQPLRCLSSGSSNRKIFAYLGAALIVFATWYGGFVWLPGHAISRWGSARRDRVGHGGGIDDSRCATRPLLRFIGKVSSQPASSATCWWRGLHAAAVECLPRSRRGPPASWSSSSGSAHGDCPGHPGIRSNRRPSLDKSMASSRYQRRPSHALAAGGAFAVLCRVDRHRGIP